MKELNEKLIISIAGGLLVIGLGFNILFPSQKSIEAKAPASVKQYKPIDIPEAIAVDSEWPEAREQAKGEMFDLFTPPEIFINQKGEFVFRPPYAVTPKGPFGIRLLEIKLNPYRFQLEGFIEEDRNDQSKTIILVHSVEDGKSLRLSPNARNSHYGFRILDWRVDRNFKEDGNTEVIARLKLEDNLTDRIINLRHDQNFYEDNIEVVFEVSKTGEIHVLSKATESFLVGDVEYRLDEIDYENRTALVSKLIPDSDPVTELLPIYTPGEQSTDDQTEVGSNDKEPNKPASRLEEAFNSFF